MKDAMKIQSKLGALLLASVLLLFGCATTIKPIFINAVTYVSYDSKEIVTPEDVANDIAAVLPNLSRYHSFPQVTVDSIGVTHKTGVLATPIGNKVVIEYRTYYYSRTGSDVTEVVSSIFSELKILSDQGMAGRFSITRSEPNEKPGYFLFHIPLTPFASSDKVAVDVANILSLLGPKLESFVSSRNERIARSKRAESNRIASRKFIQDEVFLQRKQMLENAIRFRNTVKVGVETNCGPIVDIKLDMVKVYFPVQNYGTEQWIRRDDIFPPSLPCRFLNGKYQFP